MSYQALAWAVDQDAPSTHAYAVLCVLASYADDDGFCWPSQDLIGAKTKQSDRSVRNQIAALIDSGLVIKTTHGGRSGYRLLVNSDRNLFPVHRNHVPLDRNLFPVDNSENPEPLSGQPEPLSERPEPRSAEPVNNQSLRKNIIAENSPSRKPSPTAPKPEDVATDVWDDFCALRKKKNAPLTATALGGIAREAGKAGWTLDAALRECCVRGWTGFKADWVSNDKGKSYGKNNNRYSSAESDLLAGFGVTDRIQSAAE